jgi:hypothetical protein
MPDSHGNFSESQTPFGFVDLAFGHDSPEVVIGELACGVLGSILLYVPMREKLVYFD